MENPIVPCGLFITPKDMQVLTDYVANLGGEAGSAAMIVMGMTWNLASKTVQEAIDKEAGK